jgi:hypothetical protein
MHYPDLPETSVSMRMSAGCSAPNVRTLWDVCKSGVCRELSPPNLRTPPSLATRFAS